MLGLLPLALGAPDTTCGWPFLEDAVPADGAGDLPTDTVVVLLVDPAVAPCALAAAVVDDRGDGVFASLEVEAGIVRVRPAGLGPDRTYTVVVSFVGGGEVETTFSTGVASSVPTPAAVEAVVLVDAECTATFETVGLGLVVSDAPDASLAALAIEGVNVAYGIPGDTLLEASVPGVRGACATARLYDVTGALAWESDPACLTGAECPTPPPFAASFADVERRCDPAEQTVATVLLALPPVPSDAGGQVFVELETERDTVRSGALPWVPGHRYEVSLDAHGILDACATVTYVDVWGVEQWTSTLVCAPAGDGCPWGDDLDGVGACGGCASGGGAAGLFPLAILLALRHRLRRED